MHEDRAIYMVPHYVPLWKHSPGIWWTQAHRTWVRQYVADKATWIYCTHSVKPLDRWKCGRTAGQLLSFACIASWKHCARKPEWFSVKPNFLALLWSSSYVHFVKLAVRNPVLCHLSEHVLWNKFIPTGPRCYTSMYTYVTISGAGMAPL